MDYPSRRPARDEHPSSKEEFITPFYGEASTSFEGTPNVIAAGYEEEPEIELEYPIMKKLCEQLHCSTITSATSPYRPPADTSISPLSYPPARNVRPAPTFDEGRRHGRFKGGYNNEMWTLPSTPQVGRAIFVIPYQLGLFDDAFSRWESITRNHVASQRFTDTREKIEYIENLLGEVEKLTWIQWRMQYDNEYQVLIESGDGREGTQNILSQMRRVFSLEDPTQGFTAIQDAAYRDLERLSCENVKDIIQYMNEYRRLAPRTGRLYIGNELSEKFWLKMPGDLGRRMKEAFEQKYPGVVTGVMPRISFAYRYLKNECKDAAFKMSLKDLPFYSKIP